MANDQSNFPVAAVRAALRVLPLVTLPGIWPPSAIQALSRVFRVSALSWTDLAYPLQSETGWSEDRENALRRLWHAGFTASEIAKALKVANRNAVIGKAYRLGLKSGPEGDRLTIENHDKVVAHFMSDAAQAAARACLSTFPMAVVSAAGPSEVTDRRAAAIFSHAAEAALLYGGEAARAQINAATARDQTDLERGLTPHELMWLPLWNSSNPLGGIMMPGDGSDIWSFWQNWHAARLHGSTTDGLPFRIARGLDLAISAVDRSVWDEGVGAIGDEVNHLRRKFRAEINNSTGSVPKAEPQTVTGVRFSVEIDGPIAVSDAVPTAVNQDTTDRHSAVIEAIDRLISEFSPSSRGGNLAAPIVRDVRALRDAVGATPKATRLGLAIPRGERLRQTLALIAGERNEDDAPLPSAEFTSDLRLVVSAYNILVAMDPTLEARDRAQTSPSLIDREAAPRAVAAALADAVAEGVAAPTVPAIFAEEAAIAPVEPSSDNRSSRRYTESFRNFCRAATTQVQAGIKLSWRHKSKVAVAAGTAKAAAKWIASHESLLLKLFPAGSATHELILRIVNFVKLLS